MLIKDNYDRLNWAHIVNHIAESMYPDTKTITLIQDNLSAHKRSALHEIHTPDKARAILNRLRFVFTTEHSSWLNIAECELSVLIGQGIKERVAKKNELEKQIKAWYQNRNLK